jgi:flagellar hook-associated protein 1 FlgK
MSITSALATAVTGLTAASRSAELVSNNVSNAMTEGYGRREIELSARNLGGTGAGVEVTGVRRDVDATVIRDRRLADAAVGQGSVRSAFLDRLAGLFGAPDDPASLSGRTSAWESALVAATSRPDSTVRLQNVLDAAMALASAVNAVSDGIQAERAAADADIARQVEDLNRGLREVQSLNAQILRLDPAERAGTALLDQRQRVIDRIASIVPLREYPRENGTIALYTTTGAGLLDGSAATLSFTPTPVITPDMTLAAGSLSGIAINGLDIRTSGAFSPIAGGSLAAAFTVRDDLSVTAQARIDGLARDIVDRYQSAAVDASLGPGDAGLFTDGAGPFDPPNEEGLAGRLAVNALADPARGGELWRLRTGLGAAAPGPVGDAALLTALADAASAPRAPASAALPPLAASLAGVAGEVQSLTARDGLSAESDLGFARARQDTLSALEKRGGVDTDQEMQKLLLIEKVYAANARVVATIDDLIARLLEI